MDRKLSGKGIAGSARFGYTTFKDQKQPVISVDFRFTVDGEERTATWNGRIGTDDEKRKTKDALKLCGVQEEHWRGLSAINNAVGLNAVQVVWNEDGDYIKYINAPFKAEKMSDEDAKAFLAGMMGMADEDDFVPDDNEKKDGDPF